MEAGTRRGRFVIDLVVENPEAVLFAQALIGGAHRRHVVACKTCTIGIERRPPLLARSIDVGQQHERRRFIGLCACPLISKIGGNSGVVLQLIDRRRVGGNGKRGARIGKPIACILDVGRDDLRKHPQRRLRIVSGRGCKHLAPHLIERLLEMRVRIFTHLAFQTDGIARQLLVCVRFLLRLRRQIGGRQQKQCKNTANQAHGISLTEPALILRVRFPFAQLLR